MDATKHKKKRIKSKKRISRLFIFLIFLISIVLLLTYLFTKKTIAPTESGQKTITYVGIDNEESKDIKNFTNKEFQELYEQFAYPNTQTINENTPITGNSDADKRIIEIAKKRGYKIRSAPVADNFAVVDSDYRLQILAANDWGKLKNAAKKDGINLKLVAGYRSAEDQLDIFLSRLSGISLDSIANGSAESQVDRVLQTTAPPGYSRHHSGYTVDLGCTGEENVKFENSSCFNWMSKENYINAKKFGWIPSYPEKVTDQGPEPESWEFVWVGINSLYK